MKITGNAARSKNALCGQSPPGLKPDLRRLWMGVKCWRSKSILKYTSRSAKVKRKMTHKIHLKAAFRCVILTLAFAGSLSAQETPDWTQPFPPYRVIGNIYYVGSRGLASYLIVTPQGYILINSSLQSSVSLIRESVEKLGFRFSDIKILLISHAHWDHCAGSALVKELTGAKYMVMDADVPVVETGGKADFQYGGFPKYLYKPAKVDRVLHDGDQVKLGDAVLTAHLTPGHTKGCTTWTMRAREGSKS